MSMFATSVGLMAPRLRQLVAWIDAAVAWAEARGFEPDVLVQQRLFPDQFALVRQVQACCDTAKFAAARLTGREAPSHPDDETTVAELKARVNAVLAYLGEFSEAEFEGAATRDVRLPFLEQPIPGAVYLHEFALPNFYFHVTHAYAILRHSGVPLGKRDYLGPLSVTPKGATAE